MKPTIDQFDTLKELINIGVGRAAGLMNTMLRTPIKLQIPYVQVYTPDALREDMRKLGEGTLSAVRLSFNGAFSGTTSLVFPPDSAQKLVSHLMLEETEADSLETRSGILNEVGNIVVNGVMGSISNMLNHRLNYSLPQYVEDTVEKLFLLNNTPSNTTVLLAHTWFEIQKFQIEGNIILWFEVGSFDTLLDAVDALNDNLDK